MTTDADRVIQALHAGNDELAAIVRTLTPDQLVRRSAAAEWDVSQVLSHLGSGAVITLAALEAALAGRPTPDIEANREVWARWDAMTPQERAEGFLAATTGLLDRFDSLDVPTRESLRIDLGFLPAPVDLAAAGRFRLSEFALHSWDVRVAFDPAAVVHHEATPLLLDLVGLMLGRLAKPERLQGRKATLLVNLHEPTVSFGLALDETCNIGQPPAEPDGAWQLPPRHGCAWSAAGSHPNTRHPGLSSPARSPSPPSVRSSPDTEIGAYVAAQ